jgi:hypothetical protein
MARCAPAILLTSRQRTVIIDKGPSLPHEIGDNRQVQGDAHL